MNNIYKKFRNAFSLLELTISILIVSIIVVVCVPLIMDQMKKTEEYSYFLGFKTVEKLGSQIVAFGDPAYEIAINKQDMDFSSDFSKVVVNKTNKLFSIFTQKALAATEVQKPRTVLLSFPSYEYDLARLCNGNTSIYKNYEDEAGNTFTPEEIANMGCLDMYKNNASLKLRFACDSSTYANTAYLRADTSEDAEDFCKKVAAQCISKYSAYNPKYTYERVTLNQAGNRSEYYQCIVYFEHTSIASTGSSGLTTAGVYPTYNVSTCNGYGYYNTDSTGSLKTGCSCGAGTIPAINHPNICCPSNTITAGNVPYANKNGTCVSTGCKIGAYNEQTGSCCPANSYYSRTLGHCSCAQGYEPNNPDNLTACNLIEPVVCPTGYHLDADSDVCVVNPPITKAKRFCELIVDNYNVSYSNCENAFNGTKNYGGNSDPVSYNKSLYDSITAGGRDYLSADAVEGAFNSVLPNIVFSNGLKLWILGDKVASIAGLSYNPTGYSPEINSCVDMKVYTKAACDAVGGTHYFCPGGNRCFTVPVSDITGKLADARNCCPTVDFEDFKSAYLGNGYLRDPRAYAMSGFTVFVDITGEKDSDQGGGTLWKDVFPFYISSNGTVYPAYPLNAAKSDISLYQGGNSSALNADVYYFDIVEKSDGTKIRKKQMAYTSIPYSRAQCFALQVSAFTPYCQNLGSKFRLSHKGEHYEKMDQYIYSEENPCWKNRCYVHVKNKIKFL